MAERARRRNLLVVVLLLLLLLLLLMVRRCGSKEPLPSSAERPQSAATEPSEPAASTGGESPGTPEQGEVLTPATLTAPERVDAGAAFAVAWTGPNNQGDFVTIVKPEASSREYGDYEETSRGSTLELTAPIEPGKYEVRYVAVKSRAVLGRAGIEVSAVGAAIDAPPEVVLGAEFSVKWTGPGNAGDYLTIVPKGAADEHYASYAEAKGSPVKLTAPTEPGECEVRYVTGQAKKVLARRVIRVLPAEVTLAGPDRAIAGSTIKVTWTGPNNKGDYITVVPRETPDGRYGNHTYTEKGSPLELLTPIEAGGAELRYMTGQGNRVLARRAITIEAASVTLAAPAEGTAGTAVSVAWTGPNHRGDYITIVAKGTPDGQYAAYTYTSEGSPVKVALPKEPGEAEVRYVTGQGAKVLARAAIRVAP